MSTGINIILGLLHVDNPQAGSVGAGARACVCGAQGKATCRQLTHSFLCSKSSTRQAAATDAAVAITCVV